MGLSIDVNRTLLVITH